MELRKEGASEVEGWRGGRLCGVERYSPVFFSHEERVFQDMSRNSPGSCYVGEGPSLIRIRASLNPHSRGNIVAVTPRSGFGSSIFSCRLLYCHQNLSSS